VGSPKPTKPNRSWPAVIVAGIGVLLLAWALTRE
jgi:hypothetical protein